MRILPTGEIILELEGLPPRRIKDLLDYIEETLGPVRIIEGPGEDGGAIHLQLERFNPEEEQEDETPRLRMKDQGEQ